ncbi:MAG: hypothetical protein ACTHMS_19240 [Jatrophihabitans sp.]|uniref:hypothetical protein n=1 Tax=Jatrophihabitans sp. TaxID=1932789 RepID=UPI003F7E7429
MPEQTDEISVRSAIDAALLLLARDLVERCRPRLRAVWAVRSESPADPKVWLRELTLPGSPAASAVGALRAQTLTDLRRAEEVRRDLHEVRVRFDAERGIAALVVLGRVARGLALPCRDEIVALTARLRLLTGRAGRMPMALPDYAALLHRRAETGRRLDALRVRRDDAVLELDQAQQELVFARYEVELATAADDAQRAAAGELIAAERRVAELEATITASTTQAVEVAAALTTLDEHLLLAVPQATPDERTLFAELDAAAAGLVCFFGAAHRGRPESDTRRIGDVIEGWLALGEALGLPGTTAELAVGPELLARTVGHFQQFVHAALQRSSAQPWLDDLIADVEIVLTGLYDAATMLAEPPVDAEPESELEENGF